MGRRLATFIALALIHIAVIAYLAVTPWPSRRTTDDSFVTHVFFLTEAQPSAEEPASSSPERTVRRSAPRVRTAPITLPPEPPADETPNANPRIDWAHEAELSASRELQNDADAKRRAAPFSHDFSAQAPARPTPQLRWSHAQTHRIEPLESGGTLIWINDRCAVVLAGMVFPVCKIGKIPVRDDLFEHMNDPPVLGEAPRPP